VIAAVLNETPDGRLALEVDEVPAPEPAQGQLLIHVEACGICGTDLHILDGEAYRPQVPFVLGHEPAGEVVEGRGAAAEEWMGRRVVPTLFVGCGQCEHCRGGDERLCLRMRAIQGVIGRWGGFAEWMVIDATQAIEVPAALGGVDAAALVDSGATALNAARHVLARAHRRVLIVGGGAIGVLLAEVLRLHGQDIVVVESQAERRDILTGRGMVAAPDLDTVSDVEFQCAVDCAGQQATLRGALDLLQPHGTLVVVGYREVSLDLAVVARKELTIEGVRSGSRADLVSALDLYASGQIAGLPVARWPLHEIEGAFDSVRRALPFKAVVVMPE
jgi:2-desacetyl-2-hydroxyethyl bacteriochlorophyllide A dehydrogenase